MITLNVMDQNTESTELTNLDCSKLDIIEATLTSILSSERAVDTYAQIIDGQPTRTSFISNNGYVRDFTNVSDRLEPSEASIKMYKDTQAAFSARAFRIDASVAQAYQNALSGSREETLRLLEIVADSIHTFAGLLYASFHPETDIKPPSPGPNDLRFYQTDHFFVDFCHKYYKGQYERYPFGLLNVIGYWAETQILGGVLLFERGPTELENKNAFVQPQFLDVSFQLPDQLLEHFASLGRQDGLEDRHDTSGVLPFQQPSNPRFVNIWDQHSLRIYKHEYDLPPLLPITRTQCVGRRTKSDEKIFEFLKQNPRPGDRQQPPGSETPQPEDTF